MCLNQSPMLEQCAHLTGKEESEEVEVMASACCSPWISVSLRCSLVFFTCTQNCHFDLHGRLRAEHWRSLLHAQVRLHVQCQVPRLVTVTLSYGKEATGRTAIWQNLSEQGGRAGPGALLPLVLWWLLLLGAGFTRGSSSFSPAPQGHFGELCHIPGRLLDFEFSFFQ